MSRGKNVFKVSIKPALMWGGMASTFGIIKTIRGVFSEQGALVAEGVIIALGHFLIVFVIVYVWKVGSSFVARRSSDRVENFIQETKLNTPKDASNSMPLLPEGTDHDNKDEACRRTYKLSIPNDIHNEPNVCDAEYYLQASKEFDPDNFSNGSIIKAMTKAKGDKNKARYLYIEERVIELQLKNVPRDRVPVEPEGDSQILPDMLPANHVVDDEVSRESSHNKCYQCAAQQNRNELFCPECSGQYLYPEDSMPLDIPNVLRISFSLGVPVIGDVRFQNREDARRYLYSKNCLES